MHSCLSFSQTLLSWLPGVGAGLLEGRSQHLTCKQDAQAAEDRDPALWLLPSLKSLAEGPCQAGAAGDPLTKLCPRSSADPEEASGRVLSWRAASDSCSNSEPPAFLFSLLHHTGVVSGHRKQVLRALWLLRSPAPLWQSTMEPCVSRAGVWESHIPVD